MDLDQLRLFLDLAREENFTRVAEIHFLSQPAVSLSMQRLEDDLGVRLLERSTRRVRLTDDGHLFLGYAREILDRVDELRDVLHDRRERMVGTLRLATVHTIGLYELPPTLKEFIRRYPDVALHIDYRMSEQVYRAVVDGQADLGLVAYPESRDGLVAEAFLSDELVLISAGDQPIAPTDVIPAELLAGRPFVAFAGAIPTRKAVDEFFGRLGVAPRVRMECDNIEVLKKMVEVGLGISMVPAHTVREEQRRGTLRVYRLHEQALYRPLAVIHRRSRTPGRCHQAFLDILIQEGASLLAADLADEPDLPAGEPSPVHPQEPCAEDSGVRSGRQPEPVPGNLAD